MSDISPIGRPDPASIQEHRRQQQPQQAAQQPSQQRSGDQVQLTDHARLLSQLRELPERQELVDRVRSELAGGTYETDAKLDQALDEMAEDLL
jgi:negative regulator of flagellin synthesis FlgM